jgi:hypothetical protein
MILYRKLLQTYTKFIHQVPFIKLGEITNFEELLNEFESNDVLQSPKALLSTHPVDLEYTGVDVVGLFDYDGKDFSHLGERYLKIDSQLESIFKIGSPTNPTALAGKLPKISTLVKHILEQPGRVRISRLSPHKHGEWHSHGNIHPLLEVVLHIPLISNQLAHTQVGQCPPLFTDDSESCFRIPKKYHTTHFKPGEIWLLNGMMSHRVINDSDQERVHIWCQSFFLDHDKKIVNTTLLDMLDNAIQNYKGPYFEKQSTDNPATN